MTRLVTLMQAIFLVWLVQAQRWGDMAVVSVVCRSLSVVGACRNTGGRGIVGLAAWR